MSNTKKTIKRWCQQLELENTVQLFYTHNSTIHIYAQKHVLNGVQSEDELIIKMGNESIHRTFKMKGYYDIVV